MADIFRLRTWASVRGDHREREREREGGGRRRRRHHSSFSCLPNEAEREPERRGKGRATNLDGPPFVPQSAAERRLRAFWTPWNEPWNAAAGGHSSDSTDGAKERMMIEWGKARQTEREREREREREGGGEEEPDTQRGKEREGGRR